MSVVSITYAVLQLHLFIYSTAVKYIMQNVTYINSDLFPAFLNQVPLLQNVWDEFSAELELTYVSCASELHSFIYTPKICLIPFLIRSRPCIMPLLYYSLSSFTLSHLVAEMYNKIDGCYVRTYMCGDRGKEEMFSKSNLNMALFCCRCRGKID